MMNKKIIIVLMIAVALVSAGAVAAITMNYDPDMKTASFDGIKMKVPDNAKFTKTAAGFEDTKYGISVQTFKTNESIVNYLKTVQGAKMISVANLPANAVAYEQGDMTYILVTNGQEALCVGALDKDLDVEMANSIQFNDGKKTKVTNGVAGIGKNRPNIDVDFTLIGAILVQVNTIEFNQANFIDNATVSINLTDVYQDANGDMDDSNDVDVNGQLDQNNGNYLSNGSSGDANAYWSSQDSSDSVLGDDPFNTGIVTDLFEDEGDNSYSSDAGSADAFADEGSSDAGSDAGSGSDADAQELSESECRELAEQEIPSGYTISDVDQNGDVYKFEVEDEDGNSAGSVSVNAKTGHVTSSVH